MKEHLAKIEKEHRQILVLMTIIQGFRRRSHTQTLKNLDRCLHEKCDTEENYV